MTGIIAGQLHPRNKDAIDWHPKGLVGYGCHTVLTIVDVSTYSCIQTLCGHEKAINLVKFGLQESFDENAYGLKCVSSDISGRLIVWSVIQGKKETSFQKPGDEVTQISWFTQYDLYTDYLLTLHASNTVVLWNTKNGDKIWILNFASKIFDFSIDPRNYTNIAFAATNSIVMFLKNVSIHETPVLNDINLQTIKFADETSTSEENQIVQIAFHRAFEDLLFAIFPSKVALLHTESKQIIATINTENMFPLCRILPCSERDAFYLVHSNGVISFWRAFVQNHKDRFSADLTYDQVSYNDAQRFFSKNRIFGAQICPTTESNLALLFNSGKLVFYQLNHHDQITLVPYRVQSLADITSLENLKESKNEVLNFTQAGFVPSLGSNATIVRIRPMDNIQMSSSQFGGKHLAAVGSVTGSVQFIDVFSGKIEKELNIHNCAVKCLEWAGCDMIVSAAYSSSVTINGSVRNDIFLTNVLTGTKKRLRPETDESPVQLLRVSFYQRYLAVSFRNDPLEIWDLQSHRLLRRMSRKCPIIVDMAWSGKHHAKRQTENDSHIFRENLVVLDNESHIYHVIVKGLHVRDGKEVNTPWKPGSPPIRCMAWNGDILAFGDVNGYLRIWDLSKRTYNQVNSQVLTGPILRCVFSRLFGDAAIAVQYTKGIIVFDALNLKPSPNILMTDSTLLDCDMFGVVPVCISAEGIFRFAANTTKNNCLSESEIPLFLTQKLSDDAYEIAENPSKPKNVDENAALNIFKQKMENESDLMVRNIAAAKFGGNIPAMKLLQVTDCYKSKRQLPPSLSLFWQPKAYRKRAKEFTKILLGTCKTAEQLDYAVEKSVVLKKFEWAKYALLNADISMPAEMFRLNSFKGCLLNSEFESEEPRCFIKMVATNLIAQNQISDGIILLFLIEQGLDACRFLASNGKILQSVQYSKMSKGTNKNSTVASAVDSDQFFLKLADQFAEEHNMMRIFAALIFASLGKWEKARDLMLDADTFGKRFNSLVKS